MCFYSEVRNPIIFARLISPFSEWFHHDHQQETGDGLTDWDIRLCVDNIKGRASEEDSAADYQRKRRRSRGEYSPLRFVFGGLILIRWCGSCTVGCHILHKPVIQLLNWICAYTYTSAVPPTDFGATALRVSSFHSPFRLISHIKHKLWLKSILSGNLFLN